jgi:hypothetical protein
LGSVTTKNYNVCFAGHAVHADSLAAAGILQRSFDQACRLAREELRSRLVDLHAAVAELCNQLPAAESKRDAAEALEVFAREITRAAPREPWYRLSAGALVAAAGSEAAVGAKVIEVVKAICDLEGLAPVV